MSKSIKKTKTFKEYYQDPAYRERHNKYMLTKVPCACGTITARNNMSHHKKTMKHQRLLKIVNSTRNPGEFNKNKIALLQKEIDEINTKIEKLKN
jgi:hypothetical protein